MWSAVGPLGDAIGRLLEPTDHPAEAIGRVIDFVAANPRESDYEHGCPVGSVAVDVASTSEPIRTRGHRRSRSSDVVDTRVDGAAARADLDRRVRMRAQVVEPNVVAVRHVDQRGRATRAALRVDVVEKEHRPQARSAMTDEAMSHAVTQHVTGRTGAERLPEELADHEPRL